MNIVLRRGASIRKCQMSLSALHVKWTPGKRMGLPTNEGHAMKVQSRTRSLATAALVALLVASFGAAAAAPQPRDDQRKEHRNDRKDQHHDRRHERRADKREHRKDDRQAQQRQRQAERQRERAQHRYYQQRLSQPRVVHHTRVVQPPPRVVHHTRVVHVPAYRYSYGGQWYSTSRYGADMLREAVRRGYQEGLRAGRADSRRNWNRGYRDSRVWIDASYGYNNDYVRRADYQHYFRQGFDRGYQDGYYGRQRYGRYDDRSDTAIIFTAVLAAILGLQAIG